MFLANLTCTAMIYHKYSKNKTMQKTGPIDLVHHEKMLIKASVASEK